MFRFASTLKQKKYCPAGWWIFFRGPSSSSDVMDGFWRNPYTHTHTHSNTPTRCYLVSISHQTYHHLACVCVCVPKWKGGNVSFRFRFLSFPENGISLLFHDCNWLKFFKVKENEKWWIWNVHLCPVPGLELWHTSPHSGPDPPPRPSRPSRNSFKKIDKTKEKYEQISKQPKMHDQIAGQIPIASGGGRSRRSAAVGRSRRRTGCGGSQQQAAVVGPDQLRAHFRQGECDCRHSRHLR